MVAVANRVVLYYQTQYSHGNSGTYVSPLPLIGYVTHLLLAAFHLNMGHVGPDIVHLNDFQPSDPWGRHEGAAPGTYACLTDDLFDTYYPALKEVITTYNLDGMDLDVEEYVSSETIARIITTLKADFGDEFLITLAPVASALTESGNLSGFDYITLEQTLGDKIDFYNAQFYSGFGTFFPETQYEAIINYDQGIDPARVTATVLTSPNDGYGYVSTDNVVQSIENLMEKYGTGWGGVGGWEYFNALPDSSQPWKWAVTMKEAMRVQKAKMEAREREKELAAAEVDRRRIRSRMFKLPANEN
ncbi:endo-beta-N-acetylglucosaminidase [Epithele typhae]|uniref:endo-beta-N-acetylglucosaminidase n=1 Tax=Epithele typhae TaxID=378194 RepID=UPI002007D344|nr:endo-beta-N-acetylglucosaminidase [Epithele typhae]KAH9935145.1 endo-beta-N-acetylglucosaminidase [Epithele typhae]